MRQPFYEKRDTPFWAKHTRLADYPPHVHDHVELLYVTNGSLTFTLEGKSMQIGAGDAAVIFPHTVHSYEAQHEDARIVIVLCASRLTGVFQKPLHQQQPESPVLHKALVHPNVEYAMHSCAAEYMENHTDEALRVHTALVQLVLAHCMPQFALQPRAASGSWRELPRAIAWLQQHVDEPISLLGTAEALGMGQSRLSRMFTSCLGVSFTSYVQWLRVEKAKELLLGTTLSVTQIALDSGFDNVRSFNRTFATHTGRTPSGFRYNQ